MPTKAKHHRTRQPQKRTTARHRPTQPKTPATAHSTPPQPTEATQPVIQPETALDTPVATTDPPQPDPEPAYSRVSPEMATEIVRLKRLRPNIKLSEIAAFLGIATSTVSRWLTALDNDTVPEARKLMKTHALRAAMTITDQVDHADPRVSQGASKAIMALAGVQEGSAVVQVGVQVIVGSSTHPAGPDPFDAIMVNVADSSKPV